LGQWFRQCFGKLNTAAQPANILATESTEQGNMDKPKTPEIYMQQVLALAAEGLEAGELPIAALLVLDDEVIASATTAEKRQKRFLIHAELLALEEADRLRLPMAARRRVKLFTNLEPCLMCLGAAMSFFLGEIFYGLESPGDGAVALVKGWQRKEEDFASYQLPQFTGGLLRAESIRLFEQYVTIQPPGPMRAWAETLTKR
jgi:tRNA(adenine34) deaminase